MNMEGKSPSEELWTGALVLGLFLIHFLKKHLDPASTMLGAVVSIV